MVPKTTHKIIFSALTILVLLFIAGFAYVYLTDQPNTTPSIKKTSQNYAPIPTPPPPAANAAEGVAVESLDSPVSQGSNTAMIILTNAGSICSIVVTYNGVVSQASGLSPKTADSFGSVTWSWTIAPNTPVGNWPVKVTCTYHGRSGVVISNLQVTTQ